MSKPSRRAPNYDRKLSRRIVLDDGTKLATLRDVANLFAERFATVTSWRLLEIAIERLIAAAESVERDKIKAATDAIESVLLARRLPRMRQVHQGRLPPVPYPGRSLCRAGLHGHSAAPYAFCCR